MYTFKAINNERLQITPSFSLRPLLNYSLVAIRNLQLCMYDPPLKQSASVGIVGAMRIEGTDIAAIGRALSGAPPAPDALAVIVDEPSAPPVPALQLPPLTPKQAAFCDAYLLCRNATRAYKETHDTSNMGRQTIYNYAWLTVNYPQVRQRVRDLESAAAAASIIDLAAMQARDRMIVEGHEHGAAHLTGYVHECCRYCYGVEYRYQWVDFNEFLAAMSKAEESNEERRNRKQRELPLPTDDGGYGFLPTETPAPGCPQCYGHGTQRTVFADTTTLTGHAAAIYRGVKQTANGIEFLTFDYDKAKERLYRSAGAFGDDAASVARGAAAGAAAGAAIAQAAAERMAAMTAEDAERAYLDLVR